jgi:dihydrodipicolinate synthase/N-acetylneuraminate lyase
MFDYLTGIYNITPTPFLPDGALDETSLRRLTEFTRGTRVNGMTILGVRAGRPPPPRPPPPPATASRQS